MGGIEGARWQDDEQLHMTLAFAGEVALPQSDDLVEALAEVESAGFPVEIAGVGHFERKGTPAAVWARVPLTEPLAQLQRRVERACGRVGLALEKRVYRPHITLARLRSGNPRDIAEYLTVRGGFLEAFPVERFVLFSARDSVGGGPYVIEQVYDLAA